jgi:hypothetical protein
VYAVKERQSPNGCPMSDPKFEAAPDNAGWCVHVRWPSGKCEMVPGFLHQYEALDWIKLHSGNWMAARIMQDPTI